MNFLKDILKKVKGQEERPEQKLSAPDGRNARQAARVRPSQLHDLKFASEVPGHDGLKDLKVSNLSSTGIGFMPDSLNQWPESGSSLKGSIEIGSDKHPLEVKIVHVSNHAVGCAFQGDYAAVQDTINRYFKAEIAANKMTEVKRDVLRPESDGEPRFFMGGGNCELFFVHDAGKVVRFNLSFFGNHFTGGEGKTSTRAHDHVPGNDEETHTDIDLGEKKSAETVQMAVKFVENLAEVEENFKEDIIEMIKATH